MLSPYLRVLALPGTAWFSGAGFVARLPIAMLSLGIVLLVEHETGSYGLAGSVSGAFLLANAAPAILHGRLVDAWGQARVLPVAVTCFAVFLGLMTWSVLESGPVVLTHALSALAGAFLPQVGSSVRARWSHVLSGSADVNTAYAWESVVDEIIFVVGPTLVTFLATAFDPVLGLTVAVVAGVGGTYALAAQRSTQPPAHRSHAAYGARPPMPWGLVGALTVVCVALGTVFGAAEVATVAFAEEQGRQSVAGLLLASFSLGSLLAGFVAGAVDWRISPVTRVRIGLVVLTLTLAPLTLASSLLALAPLMFLAGLAIAPTLIAALTAVEGAVPSSRLTEGMAVLHTGMGIGLAPGATLAGILADSRGASSSYLVALAAALLGILAAALTRQPAGSDAGGTGGHGRTPAAQDREQAPDQADHGPR